MSLPGISGRFTAPKPWQIATGAGVVVAFVILGPAVRQMVTAKKKQETADLTQVAKAGEPWHPAAFPQAQPVHAMPEPPAAIAPMFQQAAASTPLAATSPMRTQTASAAPGKPPMTPEEEAIAAPILVSNGNTGGQSAPPRTERPAGEASLMESPSTSAMGELLKPTELAGYKATVMRHPGMTIEQGRIIQCHNVTPLTSGLPGFVQARIAQDVWSSDGTMKLIDHDSTMFGEIAHGLTNGQERLFVLWRQITTPPPNLVRITLNSPAADEMGEAGLPGDIDRHVWRKLGGALMLSGIQAVLSGVSSGLSNALSSHGNSSNGQQQNSSLNFYQFSGSGNQLASQLLESTIHIPDTLHRDQALPCSAFVSGDLDFSGVYSATRKN